jgi:hypothetical protein
MLRGISGVRVVAFPTQAKTGLEWGTLLIVVLSKNLVRSALDR